MTRAFGWWCAALAAAALLGCGDGSAGGPGGGAIGAPDAAADTASPGPGDGGAAGPGDLGPDEGPADVAGPPDAISQDATPGEDADAGGPEDAAPGEDADAGGPEDAAPGEDADAGGPEDAAPGEDADAGGPEDAAPGEDADAGGDAGPPLDDGALFPLPLLKDAASAACTFTSPRTALKDGVLLDVWDLTYVSYEHLDGALQPIAIKAFAARPALAAGPLPGVVQAHGLGGFAEEAHATGTAALLGAFVVAYTGPGGGTDPSNTSGGLPASHAGGYRMWDVLESPRGSWFWGHAAAAMRAVTCLAGRDDVDASRLGITGFSAGGVASLTVSAVDDRVTVAVPLSASGAWDVATASPDAWQHTLLAEAGLTTASPEWPTFLAALDPAVLQAGSNAAVFMVNGSSDEFFPLTAHVATFDALPSPLRRTALAANFDHGCYGLTGVEPAETIEARADLRARGAQRAFFAHAFGTDPDFAWLPAMPELQVTNVAGFAGALVVADPGGPSLEVESVALYWSNDDAFLFGEVGLDPQGGGLWGGITAIPLTPGTILYADVTYRRKGLLGGKRFVLSTRPSLPAGLVPHIRGITDCL